MDQGPSKRSFGLNVARIAGIPKHVIEVAEKISLMVEENNKWVSILSDGNTGRRALERKEEVKRRNEIRDTFSSLYSQVEQTLQSQEQ